jgi:FtsH-binding integral membrane protein
MASFRKKRNPKLERMAHYLAGVIIIIKGVDKADHFNAHPFVCLFLFFMGAFIIFANFRHHYFEAKFAEFKSVLFFCEGLVLGVISYYYFAEGKKALPYAYALTAIAYLIFAVVKYKRKKKLSVM